MSIRSQNADRAAATPSDERPNRRGAALLARYGGQTGPTGTANPATGDASVSLASFMGGKAAGPRLGKLAGDGRSPPPEADLIEEIRYQRGAVIQPGMGVTERTTGPGRGLASFLEARSVEHGTSSPSSAAFKSQSHSAAAPSMSSEELWSIRPSSQVQTALSTATAPYSSRPSPVRRSTSPSKQSSSPIKADFVDSTHPIAVAMGQLQPVLSRNGPSQISMKHASTSPIRQDDLNTGGLKSITPSLSRVNTSWPEKVASLPLTESAHSPTFASLHRAGSVDRQPTASLTRLKGKGMVGQRLKEAKEREEREAITFDANAGASLDHVTASRFQSCDRLISKSNLPSVDTSVSNSSSTTIDRKWSPQRSGNALPGLSRPQASSPRKGSPHAPSPDRDTNHNIPPVRLPGLGAASSPFGPSGGRPESPKKAIYDPTPRGSSERADDVLQPLQSLTKTRTKGPARRTARSTPTSEALVAKETRGHAVADAPSQEQKASTEPKAQVTVAHQSPSSKPLRSTSGSRIVVLISGSGSNLQALIDATQKETPSGPLDHAQICFVLSNRKAAYGLIRASTSNPPIPTHILALKTWQNRNPGGTREQYDEVLAKAVLRAEGGEGSVLPPPDLVVLAGFMHIVSPVFLRALGHETDLPAFEAPSWRPEAPVPIINLHPALPGAFDGANAISRAFEAFQKGELDRTGVMVHEVVAEVDRGTPILVREVPILPNDTLETLTDKMHRIEHDIIVEATALTLQRIKQGQTQTQAMDTPANAVNADTDGAACAQASTATNYGRSVAALRVQAASQPKSFHASSLSSGREASTDDNGSPSARALSANIAKTVHINCASDRSPLPSVSLEGSSLIAQKHPVVQPDTKTLSVETLLIRSDGSISTIPAEEAHVLYDGEVQAIIHRFKSPPSAETVQTKLFARFGARSILGKKAAGHANALGSTTSKEGQKLADLAIRFNTKPIDSRQGRESSALAALFPKQILETRQGFSRSAWDKDDSMLWRVSCPEPSVATTYIDQVDLSATSLCSASTFVLSAIGKVYLWHGVGSVESERQAARDFACSGLAARSSSMVEMDEDHETDMWWSFLGGNDTDVSTAPRTDCYAKAWHHRRRRLHAAAATSLLRPRLFLVTRKGAALEEVTNSEGESCFTSSDIPVAGVCVILAPRSEVYVLVGPDARTKRKEIGFALDTALGLAAHEKVPGHVVVYPSITPKDLAGRLRYWSAYAEGLQRGSCRLNVVGLAQAQRELAYFASREAGIDARLIADKDSLPVGLGPEDILS